MGQPCTAPADGDAISFINIRIAQQHQMLIKLQLQESRNRDGGGLLSSHIYAIKLCKALKTGFDHML